jgi:hypothetical protein
MKIFLRFLLVFIFLISSNYVFSATFKLVYDGSHFVGYEGNWATFDSNITASIGTHNFKIDKTPNGANPYDFSIDWSQFCQGTTSIFNGEAKLICIKL